MQKVERVKALFKEDPKDVLPPEAIEKEINLENLESIEALLKEDLSNALTNETIE